MSLKNESAATTPPIRQVFHGVKKPELVFRHGGKPVVRFPGSWKRAVWGLAVGLLPVFQAAASKPPENAVYGSQRNYGQSGTVGDPISAASGAFSWSKTLFDLGGPMGLHFTLTYRTDPALFLQRTPGDFPPDFDSWMDVPIVWSWSPAPIAYDAGVNAFRVFTDDGTHLSFQTNAAGNLEFVLVDGYSQKQSVDKNYQLKKQDGWLYFCDPSRGCVTMLRNAFGTLYRPEYVLDRNTNSLVYLYDSDSHNNPRDLLDNEGRELHLAYVWYDYDGNMNFKQRLVEVVDQATRSWSFHYETNAIDNNGRVTLRAIVGPDGQTNRFRYTPNHFVGEPGDITTNLSLLESVIEPMGNFTFSNEYAHISLDGDTPANVRVCAQADAYGNKTVLSMNYVGGEYLGTVTNADGSTEQFAHERHHDVPPSSIRDESGSTMSFGINSNALLTTVTDRLDGVTFFGYDASGRRLETVTNAAGHVLRFTYETVEQTFHNPATNQTVTFDFDQLTRIDFPDGTFETFACDGRGNVTARTDRAGHVWTTTYDDHGRILSESTPLGGLTTYAYTSNGLLQSVTNSDGFFQSYGYDSAFRLTSITNADGTAQRYAYDKMDRLTATVNELNQTNSITYDANGRLVSATDPCGQSVDYQYDLMNRVTGIVDRVGGVSTRSLDERGRLASFSGPDGIVTTLGYENGHWLATQTTGGSTWSNRYDAEGLLVETRNPSGTARFIDRDALGNVTNTTDALGRASALTRDAMQCPTTITDPLDRTLHYTYSPLGKLQTVTLPDSSGTSNTWNELGELAAFRDLNGQSWPFQRSPLGRLESVTDPLGRQSAWTYNARGHRIMHIRTASGIALTNRFEYDAAGRLTNTVYYDASVIPIERDTCGRIVAAPGVNLQRDAAGRVTNTLRHGRATMTSFDAAGRLTSVSYAGDTFRAQYAYNSTNGLLERVSDTLTGAFVAFEYDEDFRLVRLARGNGTAATRTFDAAGQLTRMADGTALDQTMTYDPAGQVTQIVAQLSLNPGPFLNSETNVYAYDAAAQLADADYAYDALGRMTNRAGAAIAWRGDDTLLAIGNVSFELDGLGALLSRTEAGQTIRYHIGLPLGARSILTEEDPVAETDLRHYVWTPGGTLLYAIDPTDGNAVRYYHFDLSGNTIALSDAAGQITDTYAYDPYGRLLAHNGSSTQPFCFAGSDGMRRDGTSDLYHAGWRWYDARNACFISPEPLWPILDNPKALNPYQYAYQNPAQFMDANGLAPQPNQPTYSEVALAYKNSLSESDQSIIKNSAEHDFFSGWGYSVRSPGFEPARERAIRDMWENLARGNYDGDDPDISRILILHPSEQVLYLREELRQRALRKLVGKKQAPQKALTPGKYSERAQRFKDSLSDVDYYTISNSIERDFTTGWHHSVRNPAFDSAREAFIHDAWENMANGSYTGGDPEVEDILIK